MLRERELKVSEGKGSEGELAGFPFSLEVSACPRGTSESGNEVPEIGFFQNGNLIILPLQGANVQSRLT